MWSSTSSLELSDDARLVLGAVSLCVLVWIIVRNVRWAVQAMQAKEGVREKYVRVVGTAAATGLFWAMWQPGRIVAVVALALGVALTDGVVLVVDSLRTRAQSGK
jgi:hypothetical protein